MEYFVEIRTAVKRDSKPRLVPLEDVSKFRGFRSVYSYSKEIVEQIQLTGSTSGLRGTPVYSDTLFVDFDGTDPTPLIDHLLSEGIAFEQYDSGNRSVHLHIHTEPIYGVWVPAAHKKWIKQHGPGADMSFYNPSGQYRLPGTYHVKGGGKCKELVRSVAGKRLVLVEPEREEMPPPIVRDGSKEQLFIALQLQRRPGQRSPHIWLLGKLACEVGLTYNEAVEHVCWWNRRFCKPPQDLQTIERQVLEGYKQSERGGYAASEMAEGPSCRAIEETGT